MNKETLAQLLNGREEGSEITREEEKQAKENGLLVIFGYSDDNIEFRGVIHDEQGCYNGGMIYIHSNGILDEHEDRCECRFCGYQAAKAKCAKIEAQWCHDDELPIKFAWSYKTDLPHATFDIYNGKQVFCRGIVIDKKHLPII